MFLSLAKKSFIVTASCAVMQSAMAQQSGVQESLIHWHVMGGYSDTLGTTSSYLQGGYIFGGGISISPEGMRPLEVRFDVSYSEHNATVKVLDSAQQALNQQVDAGTGSIISGTASLLYHVPITYGVRAYGIAGVGAYHTRIELDQALPYYGGYGYGYGYDYGYGYGYGYGEAQVAAHGVTNFGWNAGVGVEFALPSGHSWFLETRYQHINSTEAVQYLPIEVGFRF